MTVRQRWTFLYPLLILAVCLGIKGELADKRLARQINQNRLTVPMVETNRIVVNTAREKKCIEIGQTKDGGGLVLVYGPLSQTEPLVRIHVDQNGRHGTIDIRDAKGRPMTKLVGTDDGGVVQIGGPPSQRSLWLGHQGELRVSGLLALEPDGGVITMSRQDRKLPLFGSYFPWTEEQPDADSTDPPAEPNPTEPNANPIEPPPDSNLSGDQPQPPA